MAVPYSNDQGVPGGATPVRLVKADGTAFYDATGGGGSGGNLAYATAAAVTVGTPFTAGNAVGIYCTVAGNVSIQLAGGPFIVPVFPGYTQLPFAATQINTVGTTATATYTNLTLGTTAIPQTFASAAQLTVGTPASPGATLMVICTSPGDINITLSGGGSMTLPASPGVQYFSMAVTEVNTSAATATFFNLS